MGKGKRESRSLSDAIEEISITYPSSQIYRISHHSIVLDSEKARTRARTAKKEEEDPILASVIPSAQVCLGDDFSSKCLLYDVDDKSRRNTS